MTTIWLHHEICNNAASKTRQISDNTKPSLDRITKPHVKLITSNYFWCRLPHKFNFIYLAVRQIVWFLQPCQLFFSDGLNILYNFKIKRTLMQNTLIIIISFMKMYGIKKSLMYFLLPTSGYMDEGIIIKKIQEERNWILYLNWW